MSNGRAPSELADRIVRLVEEHWDQHEKPLLLSQLGSLDNGEIAKSTKQESGGLKAYLQDHLADRVRVIQHSSNFTVIGAIPAQATLDDNISIDELFFRLSHQPAKQVARYHPAVWAAFRRLLEESKLRYLKITTPVHFVDIAEDEKPEGFVEVDRKFIADSNADPSEIEENIISWVQNNKLEISIFQAKRRLPGMHFPSSDLLSKLLASLGEEDLRRISMPLDIVHKLRREEL